MVLRGIWRREDEALSDAESTLKQVLGRIEQNEAINNWTSVDDLIRYVGVMGVYYLLLLTKFEELPTEYSRWSVLGWSQEVFVPLVEYFDEGSLRSVLTHLGLINNPNILIEKLAQVASQVNCENPYTVGDEDDFAEEDTLPKIGESWYNYRPSQ